MCYTSRVLDSSNTFTLGVSDKNSAQPIRNQTSKVGGQYKKQQPPLPHIMADNILPSSSENHERYSPSLLPSRKSKGFRASAGLENIARRTLGIILLLTTVVLWTASNFIQSVCHPSSPLIHGHSQFAVHIRRQHVLEAVLRYIREYGNLRNFLGADHDPIVV